MGIIDNVYVLNYLLNRQLGRKKGKMVVMFVDLKMVFDSIDRGVLIKIMRGNKGRSDRKGRRNNKTRSRVRIGRVIGVLDSERSETRWPVKPTPL